MFQNYQNTFSLLLVLYSTTKFKYPYCTNILNIKIILVVPQCIAPGTLMISSQSENQELNLGRQNSKCGAITTNK